MTLLLQQEILEPAPPRRIIVPHGAEAHYGVDVGTRAVSIAAVRRGRENALERVVVTVPFPQLEGGRRLAHAFAELQAELVDGLLSLREWRAGFVYVEQPSGKTINLPLTYMVGVVLAAVSRAAPDAVVETIPSMSWKLRACGKGNIFKPTKKTLGRPPIFMDYGVAVWARENGYEGLSWDEADAFGIAEAARRSVELVPR